MTHRHGDVTLEGLSLAEGAPERQAASGREGDSEAGSVTQWQAAGLGLPATDWPHGGKLRWQVANLNLNRLSARCSPHVAVKLRLAGLRSLATLFQVARAPSPSPCPQGPPATV